MYLLNAQQVKRYVNARYANYLDILPWDESRQQHTAYYFGLGADYDVADGDGFATRRLTRSAPLVVPPRAFLKIKSEEVFNLSEKVMGILGPVSDLADMGLQLVHSPFIDPIYHGHLMLGLVNHLDRDVALDRGVAIGKVSFFDISDTYPVELIPGSRAEQKFRRRRPDRDDDPVHPQD